MRSDREHCASKVAVEQEDEDEEDEEDEEEEEDEAGGGRRRQEEATDIKSNNPHLAGGEKMVHIALQMSASTEGVSFGTSTGIKSLERQRAPQIRALEETGRPNFF